MQIPLTEENVVIPTTSGQETDLVKRYDLGANAFVVKAVEFNDFIETVKQTSVFWAIVNERPPADAPNGGLS